MSIYTPSATTPSGTPKRDIMYWSGILLISVQLGLSVVPYALSGDWGILSVTACGTCLALLTGALPQWKKEKWACRRFSNDTYLLTRGNGAQHALVVLANGRGLNLEDLAGGQNNMDASANSWTRTAILALTVAWGMLLITATGLRDNTWYLLAVGAIGILHSIFVSGRARRPESFGIPLDFVGVFGQTKVMKTLFEVEAAYPDLGRSMLDEFFPGRLREDEIKIWAEFAHKAEQVKEALKM